MKNILEAVTYIHERDYIHRDLKPENILLNKKNDCEIKIIDFGLSTMYRYFTHDQIDDKIGTLVYMAPEQANQQNYSKRIDIWACGIIMYQLMTQGEHPLYKPTDSYQEYLGKLKGLKHKHIHWNFPSNFSK